MKTKIALTVVLLTGMASATMADDKGMQPGGMNHGQMDHSKMNHGMEKAGEANGVGVINSVDAEKGMINITHEPMPELGWPTMTMDMPVTKHVDLGVVKSGDKVDFKVKLGRDKQYRVIEMVPAK